MSSVPPAGTGTGSQHVLYATVRYITGHRRGRRKPMRLVTGQVREWMKHKAQDAGSRRQNIVMVLDG